MICLKTLFCHRSRRARALRGLLCVLLLCLTLGGAALPALAAEASPRPTLTITVVERIPAEDIEENPVPLAALPDSAARSGLRHALLMGATLLAVIAYCVYFSRYEARLFRLRLQAARCEQRAMRRNGEVRRR